MLVRSLALHIAAALVGCIASAAVAVPATGAALGVRTIGVDEIKDGMKGYGLTVFKGTTPERFDVEVVGVLRNFRPSQPLILVKTPHPRLDVTKNVKGMSGSPIYLDGRLAGAYAYSLASFQAEPVAGITPIGLMLAEMRRPVPPGFWPLDGGAPLPRERSATTDAAATPTANRFTGAPGRYDLDRHAEALAARAPRSTSALSIEPVATPLLMGGMTERAAASMRSLFEPLGLEPLAVGGGGAGPVPADAPLHFVDGGAVGVQLSRGDVSFMGLGTVTHVDGTRLCAFGHPMMEAGNTALPTVIGRVHWIYASGQHSFKVGDPLRPLGALVQDRQSAIVVDETKTAPTFPVHVTLRGAAGIPKADWSFEVAEEPFMSAALVSSAFGSIIDASLNERRDVTWHLSSKLKIRGQGTITLEDFGVAVGGMPDAGSLRRSRLVNTIGEVLNNPWTRTRVDGVESVFTVDYARDLVTLRGSEVLEGVVAPGSVAHVRLQLEPFAGPAFTRVIDVPIPRDVPDGDLEVSIAPGYAESPAVAPPTTLAELLANMGRQSYAPRSIVASIKLDRPGVVFRGHVAERLPNFAFDSMRPHGATSGPDAIASRSVAVIASDRYLSGQDKVRVRVHTPLR